MARFARGFTLIELMIVLTVAAVIVAIAVPAYNAQMRKSRRSEVLAQLQALVLSQEQWRANNATYGTTANMGNPSATHYDIAVSGPTATGFTITATAKSGDDQVNDRAPGGAGCGAISIASEGGSQTRSPATCWQ